MLLKENNLRKRILNAVFCIGICIAGRLLPHIPNVTPMTSLSLFAGSQFKKLLSLLTIIFALLVSDIVLAYLQGHPIFSSWSLFTYSGFIIIALFGTRISSELKAKSFFGCLLGSSIFFWLWTNFGVWLTSNLYAKTFQGLIICYTAALPFLRNEVCGNLIWGLAIWAVFNGLQLKKKVAVKVSAHGS
jgi:hypothetical protein